MLSYLFPTQVINNRFKTYIETFLDIKNTNYESVEFKSNLNKLQSALANAAIATQERGGIRRQILFSEIAINNPNNLLEEDYRKTHYKIQRVNQKIITTVSKRKSTSVEYFKFEQESFEETVFDVHEEFKKLSDEQQGQCKAVYKKICPYVTESVLCKNSNNEIVFIADRTKVSRGIIEVLYLLHCSLMHGEVFPDNNTGEVYKYAYYVLAMVLKKLM